LWKAKIRVFAQTRTHVLGILLMWAVRRWPYEAFQAAQTGARAHQPLGL
jgi:hypothetical protein